jgi:SMODS and SLOG-associating 2TM effector domain family 4
MFAGTLSLLAAALTALQTFMSFEDRAKEHKTSGNKFSALRREFELYLLESLDSGITSHSERVRQLKILTEKFSAISSEVPKVPERIWKKANEHEQAI